MSSSIAGDKWKVIRRWPSPQQGRALEVIGHAIEYLQDMYVMPTSPASDIGDLDAVHLLQRHSMGIFNEMRGDRSSANCPHSWQLAYSS
jgi:hypothetical protein